MNKAKTSKARGFRAGTGFVGLALALTITFPCSTRCAETKVKKFATPEEAVASLKVATTAADTAALKEILGPNAEEVQNPDRVQAANELKTFSSALAETNHLVRLSDTRVLLEVGDDLWPFSIPIVKKEGGWFFDTDAGKEELL